MLLFSSLSSACAYDDSQACFLRVSFSRTSLFPSKHGFWDGPCSQSVLDVAWVWVALEETYAASFSPGRPRGYDAGFFFHEPGALLPCKISEADGLLSSPHRKSPPARGTWWGFLPGSPMWMFLIVFLPSCSLLPVRGLSLVRGATMRWAPRGAVALGQSPSGKRWELWARGDGTDSEEQNSLTRKHMLRWAVCLGLHSML